MKICVFHSGSPYEAWSVGEGLCDVIKRMGNEVTAVPLVPNMVPGDKPIVKKAGFPEFERLAEFDAVLVSGPEHLFGVTPKSKNWLGAVYPEWSKRKFPVLGWMHESVRRDDYVELNTDAIKRTADHIFCPAPQDEEFGFEPLPFGVDTEMFTACPTHRSEFVNCVRGMGKGWDCTARDIPLAFIGLVYDKRKEFLSRLNPELAKHNLELKIGNCMVQDIDGINIRKSAQLYAETLRRIKVFVNLPSLSQLLVTKVYETLACGALLFQPSATNGDAWFTSPYDENDLPKLARHLGEYLHSEEARQDVAKMYCSEVHKNHRLELRVEKMLAKIGSGVYV